MSSLEKRHTSRRGSMQGHRKYSDGFSDTSSVGSFMDETDREVSNLTDRAFRSLCIGEEAIYNDSEFSSPADRHIAFAKEVQQKHVLTTTCQDGLSYGIQYEEAERRSEVASTFQHSCVDMTQEQVLSDEHMSYMSNGSIEATWQQKRSTSRVSSLIKAFSSKESYCDSRTPDAILLRDKYRDFNNESWDNSALLSIQRELSKYSSASHQNYKSASFQSYRNHFHASAAAITQMETTASLVKSSKTRFHALNSTNFFFHSEFSPFQLWKDYNRFPFEREEPPGIVSTSEFPRWYDSPLYKELTAPHTFASEGRRFNRRKIEDVVPTQRSRSTVIQKASAIEKRCESEMVSNCPPWRRNNYVKNRVPSNRPSTASPTNDKAVRPGSSLLSHNRHIYDIQAKAEKVTSNTLSSSSTPFSITQLLTPVIHGREGTETSEILQFPHTPTFPDHSVPGDIDLKPVADVKQLCDSYKSKASSLLFNLKDNRKRVKSTYSPSKFKGQEVIDQNKQSSKLEDLETQVLSETIIAKKPSAVPNAWEVGDLAQQTYEISSSQMTEHKTCAEGLLNMTLVPQYVASNNKLSHGGSQGNFSQSGQLANKESVDCDFSPQKISAEKGIGNSESHIYSSSRTDYPTSPGTENLLPRVNPPAHSLLAKMSEKHTFNRKDDMDYQDLKERQNVLRKAPEINKNQVSEDKPSWQNPGPRNITNKEMSSNIITRDSLPFKGEIAALIERDKQRKANAKQYLPSANDSYTTGKETYINKVNDNIKQGRLIKEEEVADTGGSLQKYSSKVDQFNSTNISSTSQNLYGLRCTLNDGLPKLTSSLSKESNLNSNVEIKRTTHDKDQVCLQRDVKYATSDINAEKHYDQKIQCSTSLEEKHHKNGGFVAYQPYKYELNKQWHITTTENTHTADEVSIRRQLQTEKKSEQSMATRQIYQTRKGDIMTDIEKLNFPSTKPNNSSQAREDKFSINDILSIRDNEQAKKIKENKYSLTASDLIKLENKASSVICEISQEKAAKTDAMKVKDNKITKVPIVPDKHESANMLNGYIRKESHYPNEELVNTESLMKDKLGKETIMGKESDKATLRTLSYKERGQTKQEILTSKLKAHAQKEISAIKEKELAKQSILSRNLPKQNMVVSNEKELMSQELVSPKKEITAEKLNHLFQDITYSSVTYKEHRNQDKDVPKYEEEEIKLTAKAIDPKAEIVFSEKCDKAIKDVKLSANQKEKTNVQLLPQRASSQGEKITDVEKKTCEVLHEISKSCTKNQKEQSVIRNVNNETTSSKSHLSYPNIKFPNEKASVVKTKEKMCSNMLTVHCADPTEDPKIAEKKMDNPACDIFRKTTCSFTSNNDTELDKPTDDSVSETEQPSVVKVDTLTDMKEIKSLPVQNLHHEDKNKKAERGKLLRESNDEKACVSTVKCTNSRSNLPSKHNTNPMKEETQFISGEDVVNANEVSMSRNKILSKTSEPEEKENVEPSTKQDMLQIGNSPKTQEDSLLQKLQQVDSPKVKILANTPRNNGSQTPNSTPILVSVEVNGCSPLKELKQKNEEDLHTDNGKLMEKTDAVIKIKNQQPQHNLDRSPDHENQTQREKDLHKQTELASKDIKQSEDGSIVNRNNSKPACTENENSPEETYKLNVSTENKEQMNSQTVQDKSSPIMNPEAESHVVYISSKEDNAPVDEPVIYSIHVSSKSDAVSDDEPVIYTICVSSISDNSTTDVPESQDKSSFALKQFSTVGGQKEKETSGGKNEETEMDCVESTISDSKEAKGFFSSDEAEKEYVDSSSTKTKQDYYGSTEVNNICSSYESLLAKYGLLTRENVHPKLEQKEQEKTQGEDVVNANEVSTSRNKKLSKTSETEEKENLDPCSKQDLSRNVLKNSDDLASSKVTRAEEFGRPCQELRNPKPPEEVSELLKEGEENKQNILHPMTTTGVLKQRAAGFMISTEKNPKDIQQFNSEKSRPQNEQVTSNQKELLSKVPLTCEEAQATNASTQNSRKDIVELKRKTQVGQKVQVQDFEREKGQKEDKKENLLSKNAETVLVKSENDNHGSSCPHAIDYTDIRCNDALIPNSSHEDSFRCNSITVAENGKIKESLYKDEDQAYFGNSAPKHDKGKPLSNNKSDISPVQNSQKAVSEAVNAVIPEIVSKDLAAIKDSRPLPNKKEIVWKKALSGQDQDKFQTSDSRDIGITAFSNKQTVKENCSVSESLLKKVFNDIKVDQHLFTSPNIPVEDMKINKNELKVNKDILTVQDNLTGQKDKIKTDSVKPKASLKVIGGKDLSIKGPEEVSKICDIQKGLEELTQVQKENLEVPIENRENSKESLNLLKVDLMEVDFECESNKNGIHLKKGTDQSQYKEAESAAVKVRKDDGQAKSKFGAVAVKDHGDKIEKEMASGEEVLQVKQDDRTHIYQYHPGKGFLPEAKGNTYDEPTYVGSSHHDTKLKQKESTSSVLRKSEVTQKDKKTRPEISALADYARLRVISAEDDSTTEKDLLHKMDTCHKYNLTSVESQKRNLPLSVGGAEQKTELTMNKNDKTQGLETEPLQARERDQPLFQRDKFTKGDLEEQNQFTSRDEATAHLKLPKNSDDRVFALNETGLTTEKTLTNQMQSDTKTSLNEHQYGYQRGHKVHQSQNPQIQHSLVSQAEGKYDDTAMLRQPVHAKLPKKDIYPQVKNQESLPQISVGSILNKTDKQAEKQKEVQPEMNQEENVREPEYYTVSTMQSEKKSEEIQEKIPFSRKIASKNGLPEIPTTRPRANSSSPALGKPTMFRVKDNTIKTSSVTKAVKPHFHRSFSEEFRTGSPKEIWSSSEKNDLEHNFELNPKEPVIPPVLHEPTVASHRLPRARENQPLNSLCLLEFKGAKVQKSYLRRSQVLDDDETHSVISAMSEDVESIAESTASHVFERKSYRDTHVRPESACFLRPGSACYERPESACYERPESACSDMRTLGRPPTVPPKTEKALRRAKKLTTRRIKKAEPKISSDSQGQLETKSMQAVSSLSSPSMELITNHAVHASTPISHYQVEPNYAVPAPNMVAHPFPMTQRKLLQDPNSGQYFMVDMPVQVKTKTFFDPETGKYVQLNVRQRAQSSHPQPQPVEVLNHPYVVYPGFLPMSVSSLPAFRSSSQMSAQAAPVEEENKQDACREARKKETFQPNYHKNTHQHNNPAHGMHETSGGESLCSDNNSNISARHTNIITMSELEDFAVEST